MCVALPELELDWTQLSRSNKFMNSTSSQFKAACTRYAKAALNTIKSPQWGFVLIIVGLGLTANTTAGILVGFIGLLIALVLCIGAMTMLGYDGDTSFSGIMRFLFTANEKHSWKDIAYAAILLALVIVTIRVMFGLPDAANWLTQELPDSIVPRPDENLIVTLVFCGMITVFSVVTFGLRKRSLAKLRSARETTMNRAERRSAKGMQQKFDNHKRLVDAASKLSAYWAEASMLLCLATIALVPGALGWPWLWGVLLSVILPMFVLSVRFRIS